MKSKHWLIKSYNKFNEAVHKQVNVFLILILLFAIGCFIKNSRSETIIQNLYGFVRLTSELAVWFLAGNLICALYFLIKRRKIKDFKMNCIWISILLIVSLPYIPKLFGYYSTQIGSFYEASSYTENYVVFMSREPKTKEDRKVYTLSAQISRFKEELGTETQTYYFTGERNERRINKLCYHIDKLYFNNGGYIDFTKVESYLTILELDVETQVYDDKGNTYFIKLSSQKSKRSN